ncbi:MAG: XdhC family protein [Candidatus Tectomicrobia bacterium]|nr:XdhC family protein [Candidatus Tectomicrobia bacterium]
MQYDIFQEIARVVSDKEKGALASVIQRRGSAPMSGKAKMLVRGSGSAIGTVGGGCLEADVWAEAKRLIDEGGSPRVASFTLTESEAGSSGHICGGIVDILVEPVAADEAGKIYEEVVNMRAREERGILATLIPQNGSEVQGSKKMIVKADGTTIGSLGNRALEEKVIAEAERILREDRTDLLDITAENAKAQIFVEPILDNPVVFIFGGGHVSYFTAKVAKMVGFKVVLLDDRPAFANKERFPEADETVVIEFENALDQLPIDDSSYLVIVTRGHAHDEVILGQAVKTGAKYIGMIGSKAKTAMTFRHLEAKGIPQELLDRVSAPIGLPIGSDTPEEIAVSIVAEMIKVRREGNFLDRNKKFIPPKRKRVEEAVRL